MATANPKPAKLRTLAEVAAAVGVSRETVRAWRRAGWRDKPPFDLPALLDWLRTAGPWRPKSGSRADDPLLSPEATSPALERYREERAALARYERLRREGELIPRERIREGLGRIAGILRGVGDALERTFGAAAHKLLDEGLDDAQREMDALFDGDRRDADDAQSDNGEGDGPPDARPDSAAE